MDIFLYISRFIVEKAADCSFPLILNSATSKTDSEQCSNNDDGIGIVSSVLNEFHSSRNIRGDNDNGNKNNNNNNNQVESGSIQIDLYSSGIFCSMLSLSGPLCHHLKSLCHNNNINDKQQINHIDRIEILSRKNPGSVTASIGATTFQLQSRILLLSNCTLSGNIVKNLDDAFGTIERKVGTIDTNTSSESLSISELNKSDDHINSESEASKTVDANVIRNTHVNNSLILTTNDSDNSDSKIKERREKNEKISLSYSKLNSIFESGCFLENAINESRRVTERMVCKWAHQIMSTISDSHLHYISLGPLDITDVILISDYYVLKQFENNFHEINEQKKRDNIQGLGMSVAETGMVDLIDDPVNGKDCTKNIEIDVENDETKKKYNETCKENLERNGQQEKIQNKVEICGEDDINIDKDMSITAIEGFGSNIGISSTDKEEFSTNKEGFSTDKEDFSTDKEIFSRDAWLNPIRWLTGDIIGINLHV
jgi:hypothetical protein